MLKLYFDEDVSPVIVKMLRARGHNCISAHELSRCGLPDEQQLEYSAAEGRILITHNRVDFAELAVEWTQLGKAHTGIIMAFRKDKTDSQIANAVASTLASYDQADWTNNTAYA